MIYLKPTEFRTRICQRIVFCLDLMGNMENWLPHHGDGEWVDLWHFPLIENASIDQALKELRPSELARANKIRMPGSRARYILDHAWRNRVVRMYGSLESGYILRSSRLGKDWLSGKNAPSISFSRTGSRSVIAISNLARIGVDIEDRGKPQQWLSIAEAVNDRTWPAGCSSSTDCADWTCRQFVIKEALLKGVGVGLRCPLHAIDVGFSAASMELYKKTVGLEQARSKAWHIISEMRHSYALAVATKAEQIPMSIAVSQYHCTPPHNTCGIVRKDETIFYL